MTTNPTMTPTFESAMLSFSSGLNSRAELVPSPRAYAQNGAPRRWLGEKILLSLSFNVNLAYRRNYREERGYCCRTSKCEQLT